VNISGVKIGSAMGAAPPPPEDTPDNWVAVTDDAD
jgi:hypothetical protein